MTNWTASAANGDTARPYLRIENVRKRFGAFEALRDVSLDVLPGEFVCFLGPSGCGKTTLLRAIAGLDPQSSGRIEQGGRDISLLPPSQRDFGIVFQSYALFPNLSVRRNVGYGLEHRKMRRAEVDRRCTELLELVGLADQAEKYPAQLSGGQQQRVALARALATSPGLLLLDEPLSALDAKVRLHLRQEIKDLQRRLGVTTIMVTHDQEEALTMADRIVVMRSGVIEQVGRPGDIYGDPANPFVADFIGTMNFLPGTLIGPRHVRLGSIEIEHAAPLDGLAAGDSVSLCVRPEDVAIADAAIAAPANRMQARIADLDFLGNVFRARLAPDCLEGMILTADLPTAQVRQHGLATDQTLPIALPSERLRVYRAAP
ncbi:Fe(3+) ions import ATP-binding protein FbpC 2 [Rhodovastum atsumiense]|nr:putative 2-aminoethylphosphonate ABC transporter ATP-binding protein [Rhodovastum atsumiense]CAH2601283.1 Fe(3+) ions import ATP-binding protein FbpC 2 [Rhodovastum atsumiense]